MVWKERLKRANAWLHSALPGLRPFGRKVGPPLWWFIWDFSGLRFIASKIRPPLEDGKRKPATFFIATISIYLTIFGFTLQRYEDKADSIENKAKIIRSQLNRAQYKVALSRIASVQRTECPIKPILIDPTSVIRSWFYTEKHKPTVTSLKEAVENWKWDLEGVNLNNSILFDARLEKAILKNAYLVRSDLREAKLPMANLENAILSRARLQGADLRMATLKGAILVKTILQGADLHWADLQEATLSGASLQSATFETV